MNGSEVKLENVNKNFGDFQVLKNINLTIKKGEFFSLLGPSGCGKTTLLRIIAGFEEPSIGVLSFDDVNFTQVPSNKRPVNTVFQNYALFPHLSVFENVAFPLRLKKIPNNIIKQEVKKYLDLVKLYEHAKKYPAQLSGGQKQRIAIARALINQPSILLLDEPLSALDAKLRQQLLIELDTIHDEVGITFIYVTHDQQEALGVSDRIAVMNEGRIIQIGNSREIYEKPANSFVANFIGETNIISGPVTDLSDKETKIQSAELGEILVVNNHKHPAKKDQTVEISLRPERIEISKETPKNVKGLNIIEGTIDEIIYNGFQSKIFVKTPNKTTIKVFQEHFNNANQDNVLKWKDQVYIWWAPEDSYMVEHSKI